jgi:hypothetical protein
MSNKPMLSRRTLLRGLGTAVALPMLDAMMPGNGILQAAATGCRTARRGRPRSGQRSCSSRTG